MNTPAGRILGIDYGSERVGVAVSDPLATIARPVGVFRNDQSLFSKLETAAKDYAVRLIVVGMPLTLRGDRSQKAREVDDFIGRLHEALGIEIRTVDERFTSTIARQTMLMMGTTKKQRREKGRIDEMAAALILQDYLDSKH